MEVGQNGERCLVEILFARTVALTQTLSKVEGVSPHQEQKSDRNRASTQNDVGLLMRHIKIMIANKLSCLRSCVNDVAGFFSAADIPFESLVLDRFCLLHFGSQVQSAR